MSTNTKKLILILPLAGLCAGFLISYLFAPRYTSQATLTARLPHGPRGFQSTQEFEIPLQRIFAATNMRAAVRALPPTPDQSEDKLIAEIQANTMVTSGETTFHGSVDSNLLAPVFYIRYTDSNPLRAQTICRILTTLVLEEGLRQRTQQSSATYEFLQRNMDQAEAEIEALGKELGKYQKQKQLPSAEEKTRYKNLMREYGEARQVYTDLLRKREEADVSSALEGLQYENSITVLEPATLPESPSVPNRLLFAGTGMLSGIVLATALSFTRSLV